MARLQHEFFALGERDQLIGLREGGSDRLLDQHMHTVLQAGARDLMVAVGRHRDHRGIRLAEDLPVIAERRATELGGERGGARRVRVHHGDQIDAG